MKKVVLFLTLLSIIAMAYNQFPLRPIAIYIEFPGDCYRGGFSGRVMMSVQDCLNYIWTGASACGLDLMLESTIEIACARLSADPRIAVLCEGMRPALVASSANCIGNILNRTAEAYIQDKYPGARILSIQY